MKDQINTIREALNLGGAATTYEITQALAALAQIEAMAGEQEPVGEVVAIDNGDDEDGPHAIVALHGDVELEAMLYAAPVAQQPHAIPRGWTIVPIKLTEEMLRAPDYRRLVAASAGETERRYLGRQRDWEAMLIEAPKPPTQQPQARPDFTDEWTGYLKDGETPFERFLRERKDMQSVLKLYQRVLEENERLKAQQPQAKPHKPLFADLIAQHPGLREELLEIAQQPQAEPFGYVSQHTNGTWEFSPTPAGVYPDTAKSITAVYAKQPQAEAVPTIYVSRGQLENLKPDPEDEAGTYLPVRKTPKGKFTHPLFAAPQQAEAVRWCPDVCPITGKPFFMWIGHPKHGEVPTYGGPYDSYTIPVRHEDGSFCCERYDHDNGWWVTDEVHDVGVQIVSDQAYVSDEAPQQAEAVPPDALHTFLDAAAGEGLVLGGVDAADLYVALFPERYAAAIAVPKQATEVQAMVWRAASKVEKAAQQAEEMPHGFALVPVEPTEAMHQAAVKTIQRCTGNDDFPPAVWKAMIAAAQGAKT